jgi:hypothetical protein
MAIPPIPPIQSATNLQSSYELTKKQKEKLQYLLTKTSVLQSNNPNKPSLSYTTLEFLKRLKTHLNKRGLNPSFHLEGVIFDHLFHEKCFSQHQQVSLYIEKKVDVADDLKNIVNKVCEKARNAFEDCINDLRQEQHFPKLPLFEIGEYYLLNRKLLNDPIDFENTHFGNHFSLYEIGKVYGRRLKCKVIVNFNVSKESAFFHTVKGKNPTPFSRESLDLRLDPLLESEKAWDQKLTVISLLGNIDQAIDDLKERILQAKNIKGIELLHIVEEMTSKGCIWNVPNPFGLIDDFLKNYTFSLDKFIASMKCYKDTIGKLCFLLNFYNCLNHCSKENENKRKELQSKLIPLLSEVYPETKGRERLFFFWSNLLLLLQKAERAKLFTLDHEKWPYYFLPPRNKVMAVDYFFEEKKKSKEINYEQLNKIAPLFTTANPTEDTILYLILLRTTQCLCFWKATAHRDRCVKQILEMSIERFYSASSRENASDYLFSIVDHLRGRELLPWDETIQKIVMDHLATWMSSSQKQSPQEIFFNYALWLSTPAIKNGCLIEFCRRLLDKNRPLGEIQAFLDSPEISAIILPGEFNNFVPTLLEKIKSHNLDTFADALSMFLWLLKKGYPLPAEPCSYFLETWSTENCNFDKYSLYKNIWMITQLMQTKLDPTSFETWQHKFIRGCLKTDNIQLIRLGEMHLKILMTASRSNNDEINPEVASLVLELIYDFCVFDNPLQAKCDALLTEAIQCNIFHKNTPGKVWLYAYNHVLSQLQKKWQSTRNKQSAMDRFEVRIQELLTTEYLQQHLLDHPNELPTTALLLLLIPHGYKHFPDNREFFLQLLQKIYKKNLSDEKMRKQAIKVTSEFLQHFLQSFSAEELKIILEMLFNPDVLKIFDPNSKNEGPAKLYTNILDESSYAVKRCFRKPFGSTLQDSGDALLKQLENFDSFLEKNSYHDVKKTWLCERIEMYALRASFDKDDQKRAEELLDIIHNDTKDKDVSWHILAICKFLSGFLTNQNPKPLFEPRLFEKIYGRLNSFFEDFQDDATGYAFQFSCCILGFLLEATLMQKQAEREKLFVLVERLEDLLDFRSEEIIAAYHFFFEKAIKDPLSKKLVQTMYERALAFQILTKDFDSTLIQSLEKQLEPKDPSEQPSAPMQKETIPEHFFSSLEISRPQEDDEKMAEEKMATDILEKLNKKGDKQYAQNVLQFLDFLDPFFAAQLFTIIIERDLLDPPIDRTRIIHLLKGIQHPEDHRYFTVFWKFFSVLQYKQLIPALCGFPLFKSWSLFSHIQHEYQSGISSVYQLFEVCVPERLRMRAFTYCIEGHITSGKSALIEVAEKALKKFFKENGTETPYTNNIADLFSLLISNHANMLQHDKAIELFNEAFNNKIFRDDMLECNTLLRAYTAVFSSLMNLKKDNAKKSSAIKKTQLYANRLLANDRLCKYLLAPAIIPSHVFIKIIAASEHKYSDKMFFFLRLLCRLHRQKDSDNATEIEKVTLGFFASLNQTYSNKKVVLLEKLEKCESLIEDEALFHFHCVFSENLLELYTRVSDTNFQYKEKAIKFFAKHIVSITSFISSAISIKDVAALLEPKFFEKIVSHLEQCFQSPFLAKKENLDNFFIVIMDLLANCANSNKKEERNKLFQFVGKMDALLPTRLQEIKRGYMRFFTTFTITNDPIFGLTMFTRSLQKKIFMQETDSLMIQSLQLKLSEFKYTGM